MEDEDEDDDGDGFSTFVVRESVSGTVVRRTSGGDGGGGSTMSRAVASMRAVGDLGFGKQRKGSGSSQGDESRQLTKMSSSSIPESVTREDPTTKYELLNELGELIISLCFEFLHFLLLLLCNYAEKHCGVIGFWQGKGLMVQYTRLGI